MQYIAIVDGKIICAATIATGIMIIKDIIISMMNTISTKIVIIVRRLSLHTCGWCRIYPVEVPRPESRDHSETGLPRNCKDDPPAALSQQICRPTNPIIYPTNPIIYLQ